MQEQHMLTTVNNPFDPFTEYKEWFVWDMRAGYNTPGYLARVARVSHEMSEADRSLAIKQAIDDIVRENFFGVHKRVVRLVTEESED